MTSATEQTGAAVRRFAAGIMAADGPRVTARSAGCTAGPAGNRTGLWPAGSSYLKGIFHADRETSSASCAARVMRNRNFHRLPAIRDRALMATADSAPCRSVLACATLLPDKRTR
jgi:hypothetical protein